ncbi:cryptochrome/photolyase family protein [Thioclava sp. GXIMD2076]|uniref:cryptochrome/photolyase family protein n=1 Tax=Thioclava sp. GXIMD2076 TaxID=3131931 RepID=UPI0030CBE280
MANKPRLVLVLGDQLTAEGAALRAADKTRDVIVMAEVRAETDYVGHHKQKIALVFAAMRAFAEGLRADGWTVAYTRFGEAGNSGSITGEILRRAEEHGAASAVTIAPGEWRLRQALEDCPIPVVQLPDDRFLCSEAEFAEWAKGRKSLRMEYFYREMRRKTGLLMAGDDPEGGQWNYDAENRKPAQADLFRVNAPRFAPDGTTREVLDLVAREFADNFGGLEGFNWAVDRKGAQKALAHFIAHNLADFGTYQDAMLEDDPLLYHSLLSPYLNLGLLGPLEVCQAAARAYAAGKVPLNSAEGFIRQIIGWREYVRGIYFHEGPDYTARNHLDQHRKLPWAYWGGKTEMNCLRHAVAQTRDLAYAHHIQRLMITGNFALLAGVDPAQVQEWYLAVYIDAFEWVEAPNTAGMSQFADGGVIASKPYVSSGAYIDRMSDYCGSCAYSVKKKMGEGACPFNLLYWHFLDRNREKFAGNPRMAVIYRSWDKRKPEDRETILGQAETMLNKIAQDAF